MTTPDAAPEAAPGSTAAALPESGPVQTRRQTGRRARHVWLVPTGLLLLAVIPALGGSARLAELASDPVLTEENARFVSQPLPVVLHIVCVTVYSMLGAFQFVPSLRRRRWHRWAGRVLAPAGVGVALTGLWMTAFYDLPVKDTAVVNGMRYLVGTTMLLAIVLGVRAALRRDFATHSAWMTRAYALAMGAGTQGLLLGPLVLVTGSLDPVTNSIGLTAGWLINIAVAEWVIHRRRLRERG
ncbi:DUF2306 domain-containing protein [Promicromonospora sukumoe]|uniref:DUF2306 domain-containing protein n=1 Tax=Promicromonospora sukumoe TaxID=88382 RepID=UPI000374EE3A|nr:DUF2306 domain-containing protein [Promicromonospora sukumoe]